MSRYWKTLISGLAGTWFMFLASFIALSLNPIVGVICLVLSACAAFLVVMFALRPQDWAEGQDV